MDQPHSDTEPILRLLGPDERLHAIAPASDYRVLVTDRRIAVAQDERIALNIPIGNVRLVQFALEKGRPTTLAIVPQSPRDPPQMLMVLPEHYPHIIQVLAALGALLGED